MAMVSVHRLVVRAAGKKTEMCFETIDTERSFERLMVKMFWVFSSFGLGGPHLQFINLEKASVKKVELVKFI